MPASYRREIEYDRSRTSIVNPADESSQMTVEEAMREGPVADADAAHEAEVIKEFGLRAERRANQKR